MMPSETDRLVTSDGEGEPREEAVSLHFTNRISSSSTEEAFCLLDHCGIPRTFNESSITGRALVSTLGLSTFPVTSMRTTAPPSPSVRD